MKFRYLTNKKCEIKWPFPLLPSDIHIIFPHPYHIFPVLYLKLLTLQLIQEKISRKNIKLVLHFHLLLLTQLCHYLQAIEKVNYQYLSRIAHISNHRVTKSKLETLLSQLPFCTLCKYKYKQQNCQFINYQGFKFRILITPNSFNFTQSYGSQQNWRV